MLKHSLHKACFVFIYQGTGSIFAIPHAYVHTTDRVPQRMREREKKRWLWTPATRLRERRDQETRTLLNIKCSSIYYTYHLRIASGSQTSLWETQRELKCYLTCLSVCLPARNTNGGDWQRPAADEEEERSILQRANKSKSYFSPGGKYEQRERDRTAGHIYIY